MKKFIVAMAFVLASFVASQANAASVTFSWLANTEPNIVNYKVYCSTTNVQPFTFMTSTTNTTATVTLAIETSTMYCAATAVNDYAQESDYSNVATLYKMGKPVPPGQFKKN